ncbi:MAG: hypothetical protein Q9186_005296 [Xanthomendoza sp. 1 TL-2023]
MGELHALRHRTAKPQRSHRTSPNSDFLVHVLDTIDDLRRSLQTWNPEISEEMQTANHANLADVSLSMTFKHKANEYRLYLDFCTASALHTAAPNLAFTLHVASVALRKTHTHPLRFKTLLERK